MRKIDIKIDRNGSASCSSQRLGYGGEHNATVLSFGFDTEAEELYGECDFFRVVIDGYISDPIYPQNGTVCFAVPEMCVKPPEVQCQLVGYGQAGDEVETIIKSAVIKLEAEFSEAVDDGIENEPGAFERALAACTDKAFNASESADTAQSERKKAEAAAKIASGERGKAETAAENARLSAEKSAESASAASEFVAAASGSATEAKKYAEKVAEKVVEYDSVSNSLKGTVSGENAVAICDTSSIEHNMSVKIRSKNLIPFPYAASTQTKNGVTFTVNDDGSVVLNGTATKDTDFGLYSNETPTAPLLTENMFLSGTPEGGDSSTYFMRARVTDSADKEIYLYNYYSGVSIPKGYRLRRIDIVVNKEKLYDNVIFKPQLEVGSSATEYSRYVDIGGTKSESQTVDFSETARDVTFSTSADNAAVKGEALHSYCVAALAPVIAYKSGSEELTEVLDGSAVPLTSPMYGELPFNLELSYTVSGSTIAWSGFKQAVLPSTGQLYEKVDVVGSFDTGHEAVKIKGFRQIYALDGDNPLYKTPDNDTVDFSAAFDVEGKSGISIGRYGKNLIPFPYYYSTQTINGVTFTVNDDGSVALNGTATKTGSFILYQNATSAAPILTEDMFLSGTPEGGNKMYCIHTTLAQPDDVDNEDGRMYPIDYGSGVKLPKGYQLRRIDLVVGAGAVCKNLNFKPQIEVGTTATEYEEYREPKKFAAGEDGTAENVTSLYPTTVLMSDTPGVIIDCEYNRDINKAFDELKQAILSLGGNI